MKSFLTALLLCCFFSVGFSQPIVLNDPNKTYFFFAHCTILEVAPGSVTIDSLLQHPSRYRFAPVKAKPDRPNPQRAFWFKVDLTNPTPQNFFLHFYYFTNAHSWVYEVAGQQVVNHGEVSSYGASSSDAFQRSRAILPLKLRDAQTHTLYIYVERMENPYLLVSILAASQLAKETNHQSLFYGLYFGLVLLISVYSLLLGLWLRDRDNLLYALWLLVSGLVTATTMAGLVIEWAGGLSYLLIDNVGVLVGLQCCIRILFAFSFLQLRLSTPGLYRFGKGILVFNGLCMAGLLLFSLVTPDKQVYKEISTSWFGALFAFADNIFGLVASFLAYRRGFKPALFYFLGVLTIWITLAVWLVDFFTSSSVTFWTLNSLLIGLIGEFLFFMTGLAYKVNLLKKKQEEATQQQLRLSEENRQLIETQNRVLEEKVEQRTNELQQSLTELRTTQTQLIQKEKLASLGELTAGIAHEIQNPLNFVNNFSEVSTELIQEQKDALAKGDLDEVGFLAEDLTQNLQKIVHHGRRAETIVKGMLEHSRASSGERQLTNLNQLADEYLRMAYQGQRAKNKSFSCQLQTDFERTLPTVSVAAQDIGRVLLNLYNNAFYAVQQRAKHSAPDYQPTVWVSTRQEPGKVVICLKDNGPGIPEAIREKIFQPFFTTKPAGEGTGLGLSLSYDIVTKGNNGEMRVEGREGEGASFLIKLPILTN